ncbi:hypothetical protein Tco_0373583 [Tanacetum coccineum]
MTLHDSYGRYIALDLGKILKLGGDLPSIYLSFPYGLCFGYALMTRHAITLHSAKRGVTVTRLCRYPAKVRSYEDEVLFKADLAYMWEDYPRFPQILVDEQETAFKDFVYAWDATEAYYTGTEALVNDVGSPSHLVEEDTIAGGVTGSKTRHGMGRRRYTPNGLGEVLSNHTLNAKRANIMEKSQETNTRTESKDWVLLSSLSVLLQVSFNGKSKKNNSNSFDKPSEMTPLPFKSK